MKMRATWVFTVPAETNSFSAISELDRPRAISMSTSFSRSVSSSRAAGRAMDFGTRPPNCPITRRVTDGESSISLAIFTLVCFAIAGAAGHHHHGLRQAVRDVPWHGLRLGRLLLVV